MTRGGIRPAVLGAAGYIGQEFARMLADHPRFETPVLLGSDRSAGLRLADVWRLSEPCPPELAALRLRRASAGAAARLANVAFGALPTGVAGPMESELSRRGVAVFSNASDHRLEPGHPTIVPEVNASYLRLLPRRGDGPAPIVTNPNCSATGLALALAPVFSLLRPRAVHVATYQSLSGAGFPGVPSLSITDNVVPFIPGEEEKIASEVAWLLGRVRADRVVPSTVPIVPHCVRVGVREGHLEAVTVEAQARPERADLLRAWREFDPLHELDLPTAPHPTVELRSESDRPQPLADRWAGAQRARGMAAVVGRVRWKPPFLRFFVLSHNAVRGGAGGSILNAELALAQGYWGPSHG
ncbi:MAG TPA: aspartate-semialdehyde dehydrogenase [Thermoplasmata archaeon]|nr:aspartate-semialdehyde dehydrogenase [Thermoplasmata archaeon]